MEEDLTDVQREQRLQNMIEEARREWDQNIFQWTHLDVDIRQSILMEVDGAPIERQFDHLWPMEEEHRRQNARFPLQGDIDPLEEFNQELNHPRHPLD